MDAPPAEIVQLLGVEDMPGVFVLGSTEPRVTVYSQQCRALNLVWALSQQDRLPTDRPQRVAVVGGGIAGLTAAAAAAALGHPVTLLERLGRVMEIQRGSHGRWVHPHIYDWPADGWQRGDADLPTMTWSAGAMGVVVAELERQWKAIVGETGIDVQTDVQDVVNLSQAAGGRVRLAWNAPRYTDEEFDLVFLAVGFGQEAETSLSHSYWHDDSLHQGPPRPTLVSGTGDGGLTDLLRLCLDDFEQSALPDLLASAAVAGLEDRVREIEERADLDQAARGRLYFELDAPDLKSHLAALGRARIEHVDLNATTTDPLSAPAAPYNRLLAGQLLQLGVGYQPGKLQAEADGDKVRVSFARPDGSVAEREYDRVVVRHGPDRSPLDELDVTPKLSPETARALTLSTDVTRHPAWDPEFEKALGRRGVRRAPPRARPADAGWDLIDPGGLEAAAELTWDRQLVEFLGGRDPRWADVVPGRAPERAVVGELVGEIATVAASGPGVAISLVRGPSGEGKSTVLMQSLVRALAGAGPEGLAVVWRTTPTPDVPWALLGKQPQERPTVVAIDRAHDLKGRLLALLRSLPLRELAERRQAPIHFVLCAADLDWEAVDADEGAWSEHATVYDVHRVEGLEEADARAIVTAMESAADAGAALGDLADRESTDARVAALVDSARERRQAGRSSALLGALLEQRTGDSLEDHVAALLARLREMHLPSGHLLLDLYLQAGALQFHGLGGIDRDTFAAATDLRATSVRGALGELGTEVEVDSGGMRDVYRIRHDAIARAAFDIAVADDQLLPHLADVHYATVKAIVSRNPDGWREPEHEVFFTLSVDLIEQRRPELAVAAARGALDGAPGNLVLLNRLAWVNRKSDLPGGAARGRDLIAGAFQDLDRYDKHVRMRHVVAEWAACTGQAGTTRSSAGENLCLALWSLSDEFADTELEDGDLQHGIAAAGRALLDLRQRGARDLADGGLPAILALAKDTSMPSSFVDAYARYGGEEVVPLVAISVLEELFGTARRLLLSAEWGSAGALPETISLHMLRAHLGIPIEWLSS